MQTDTTLRVIEAVSEAADVDPLDLPPLYDVIDPDALNRLCLTATGSAPCTVRFEYAGHDIEIHNGRVQALVNEPRP